MNTQNLFNALKKVCWIIFIVILVCHLRGDVFAQYLPLNPGFFKGNDYLNKPEAIQIGYIAGVYDGIALLGTLGMPENRDRMNEIYKYNMKMPLNQVKAIVDKYLKDHPEVWHQPMNAIALLAIGEACPKSHRK